MTILAQSQQELLFSNQIETIRADNSYYQSFIEENKKLIKKLTKAKKMVHNFLALGEETIALLEKADRRYLEVIKEKVLSLFDSDKNSSIDNKDVAKENVDDVDKISSSTKDFIEETLTDDGGTLASNTALEDNSSSECSAESNDRQKKSNKTIETISTPDFVLADVKVGDKIKITRRYYNNIDYCGQWGEVIRKEYSLVYARMPDGTEFGLAQNQFEVKIN